MSHHLHRRVTMARRIDLVQPVSQHAYRLEALLQGVAMGTDVDAVGQSADYQHVGAQLAQVGDEAAHQVLSVAGAMARPHDVDDALLVQVGRALVIDDNRCIRTLAEPSRIVGIGERQRPDAAFLYELHLGSSPAQRLVPLESVAILFVDSLSAAQLAIQLHQHGVVDTRQASQRHAIVYLLTCHSAKVRISEENAKRISGFFD